MELLLNLERLHQIGRGVVLLGIVVARIVCLLQNLLW